MELHAIKYFYHEREGLVEMDDDVLSIVRQVKERFGDRVKVSWEPHSGHYVFIENSADGIERLIFTTPELDGRALQRLIASDSQRRGYEDAYDHLEAEQDRAQAAIDKAYRERIVDAGEQLHFALRAGSRIYVPRSVDA